MLSWDSICSAKRSAPDSRIFPSNVSFQLCCCCYLIFIVPFHPEDTHLEWELEFNLFFLFPHQPDGFVIPTSSKVEGLSYSRDECTTERLEKLGIGLFTWSLGIENDKMACTLIKQFLLNVKFKVNK